MSIRTILLVAGAFTALAAAPVAAQSIEPQKGYQCKAKYLAADWMVIFYDGDDPTYCEATLDKSGKITSSSCFENKIGKVAGSLSGKLSITKHCAITGTVTAKAKSGESEKGSAEFYMDAAATSFAGIVKAKGDEFAVVQAIRMK